MTLFPVLGYQPSPPFASRHRGHVALGQTHRRQSQIVLASDAVVLLFHRRNGLQQPGMGHSQPRGMWPQVIVDPTGEDGDDLKTLVVREGVPFCTAMRREE